MIDALILIFGFFIFLFGLYVLSQEDFVFFRKNVTLERLFNMAILTALVSLFFSRLFYVLLNFSPNFLNPLVFAVFFYFPGMSLAGGLLGGIGYIFWYTRHKKLPTTRVLDFFLASFLGAYTVGIFLQLLLNLFLRNPLTLVEPLYVLFYCLLCGVFVFLVVPRHKRGVVPDGLISMILVSLFSFSYMFYDFFSKTPKFIAFIGREDILFFLIFAVSLAGLISTLTESSGKSTRS